MKVGFLGAGTWGFCLACLLGAKGHEVYLWTANESLLAKLQTTRQHPHLAGFSAPISVHFTNRLEEALDQSEFLAEAVTSAGIRPVFTKVAALKPHLSHPIIITSKGIEQNTGLLLSEVLTETLGSQHSEWIGCLSGPSHAEEVIKQVPTSVVASALKSSLTKQIQATFSTPFFRIYGNNDLNGVQFGAAMKNIIAIACGISDGLGFGDNTKAALMTRGLHEIRKLCVTKSGRPETLIGLSGLGDLAVTCMSLFSRNYRFGRLLGEGASAAMAKEKIGMVVEGAYTCVSALQLGQNANIEIPITQAVYKIIYEQISPIDCVKSLLSRKMKEEHL